MASWSTRNSLRPEQPAAAEHIHPPSLLQLLHRFSINPTRCCFLEGHLNLIRPRSVRATHLSPQTRDMWEGAPKPSHRQRVTSFGQTATAVVCNRERGRVNLVADKSKGCAATIHITMLLGHMVVGAVRVSHTASPLQLCPTTLPREAFGYCFETFFRAVVIIC